MDRHLIRRDAWQAELDSFSRRHEGWLVSITRRSREGQLAVEAHDLPLEGVSVATHERPNIAIRVGDSSNALTHVVDDAKALRIDLTPERAERALVIEGRDGSSTRVEFRTPRRAEEVDGIPESNEP